ncbi:hypothetical protein [Bacteroides caecimuris]|uniref:hypothetical protein n=1 Tax=Bacteroides caecimuris TaxID=1796613 RepID=UPI0020CE97D8|nr:hypothetical protein [Bacteroides caecimuris]
MKRKKAEKESKNNKVKRNTQTRKRGSGIQHKEEIISEEEMESAETRYFISRCF